MNAESMVRESWWRRFLRRAAEVAEAMEGNTEAELLEERVERRLASLEARIGTLETTARAFNLAPPPAE